MNEGDIAERLIQAAEIEERGQRVGPAVLKGHSLPYVHSEADMRNWGYRRGDKRSRNPLANACRLLLEDQDGHSVYRREFWEQVGGTARDVSMAEEALGWYELVSEDKNRAALAAWVSCMCHAKRRFFRDWCEGQGIHRNTGMRRKDRAISEIRSKVRGKPMLHNENPAEEVLLAPRDLGHKSLNIGERAADDKGRRFFRDDLAFQPIGIPELRDFSWSQKRNEMRRRRAERKASEPDRKSA